MSPVISICCSLDSPAGSVAGSVWAPLERTQGAASGAVGEDEPGPESFALRKYPGYLLGRAGTGGEPGLGCAGLQGRDGFSCRPGEDSVWAQQRSSTSGLQAPGVSLAPLCRDGPLAAFLSSHRSSAILFLLSCWFSPLGSVHGPRAGDARPHSAPSPLAGRSRAWSQGAGQGPASRKEQGEQRAGLAVPMERRGCRLGPALDRVPCWWRWL